MSKARPRKSENPPSPTPAPETETAPTIADIVGEQIAEAPPAPEAPPAMPKGVDVPAEGEAEPGAGEQAPTPPTAEQAPGASGGPAPAPQAAPPMPGPLNPPRPRGRPPGSGKSGRDHRAEYERRKERDRKLAEARAAAGQASPDVDEPRGDSTRGGGSLFSMPGDDAAKAAAKANATMLVGLAIGAAVSLGGEKWNADQNERDAMIGAYAAYFETCRQIPPWLGALLATSVYTLPRLAITLAELEEKRKARARNTPRPLGQAPAPQAPPVPTSPPQAEPVAPVPVNNTMAPGGIPLPGVG